MYTPTPSSLIPFNKVTYYDSFFFEDAGPGPLKVGVMWRLGGSRVSPGFSVFLKFSESSKVIYPLAVLQRIHNVQGKKSTNSAVYLSLISVAITKHLMLGN